MTISHFISAASLLTILLLSLVKVLSCYPDGVVGKLAQALIGLGAAAMLLGDEVAALPPSAVLILAGVALFNGRHFVRFQQFRRRERLAEHQVLDWPTIREAGRDHS